MKVLSDDTTEDRLLDVLDEGLAARIIDELPDRVGWYEFSHALIQETLSEELSATRTVRMHARIAEALETLYGDDAKEHAQELVGHFTEAETVLGTDKLVDYSIAAGQQALDTYAYEDAHAIFTRALEAHSPDVTDSRKADLLIGHSIASKILGYSMQDTWKSMVEAFEFYDASGDVVKALDVAREIPPPANRLTGFTRVTRRAIEMAVPGSLDEAYARMRHGWAVSIAEGDLDTGRQHIDRAIELAGTLDDAELTGTIDGLMDTVNGNYLKLHEVADHGRDYLESMPDEDTIVWNVGATLFCTTALLAVGDDESAIKMSTLALKSARKVNHRRHMAICLRSLTSAMSVKGSWKEANKYQAQAAELSYIVRSVDQELIIEAMSDADPELIDEYVNGVLLEFSPGYTASIASGSLWARNSVRVAVVGYMLGRSDFVSQAGKYATGAVNVKPPYPPLQRQFFETASAIQAVFDSDRTRAKPLYDSLQVSADTMIGGDLISGDRLLALLAVTSGESQIAEDHFKAAIEFLEKAGYRPELAWTKSDYAEFLLKIDDPGDHDRAVELQDEAIAIATELSMKPLLERVLAQREILKA